MKSLILKIKRRVDRFRPPSAYPENLKARWKLSPAGFAFTSAHLSALSATSSQPGSTINQ